MRKCSYALFAGLILSLIGGVSAQAASITGSQAFSFSSLSANTVDLATATQFTVSQTISSGGSTQTGDYVGIPAQVLPSTILDTANLAGFTYGSATFGTFTGTFGEELASATNTRTFYITGNFAPGTDFPVSVTTNTASILITLNSNGGAITWGATQNTPAIAPASVPEPASMSLTGIGLSLIGLFLGFRKRSGK
jgi:hypothetical protein